MSCADQAVSEGGAICTDATGYNPKFVPEIGRQGRNTATQIRSE